MDVHLQPWRSRTATNRFWLALGLCFRCWPIRKDRFPVGRTDVTWLLVLLSFLAYASAYSHFSLKLPFEVDFLMKSFFPVVLLLQKKRSVRSKIYIFERKHEWFRTTYDELVPPTCSPLLWNFYPALPRPPVVSLPCCFDELMDFRINFDPAKTMYSITNIR